MRAYYADKNNRASLRQDLLDTQRKKDPDGWEILVTTYNLAQGDEKDRKFFRKTQWEVGVHEAGSGVSTFSCGAGVCLRRRSRPEEFPVAAVSGADEVPF